MMITIPEVERVAKYLFDEHWSRAPAGIVQFGYPEWHASYPMDSEDEAVYHAERDEWRALAQTKIAEGFKVPEPAVPLTILDLQYILKVQADNEIPVGSIRSHVAGYTPKGWLPCDGKLLDMVDYPDLFLVVGKTFTSPAPEPWWKRAIRRLFNLPGPEAALRPGEFRVPDMRGRV